MILQGDKLEIVVLNAGGIHREYMELRKDWFLYWTVLLVFPKKNAETVWTGLWVESYRDSSIKF